MNVFFIRKVLVFLCMAILLLLLSIQFLMPGLLGLPVFNARIGSACMAIFLVFFSIVEYKTLALEESKIQRLSSMLRIFLYSSLAIYLACVAFVGESLI